MPAAQSFVRACSQMRAGALEDLHQRDQQNHCGQHDEILVAVVTIVDGDLAEPAAADDAAHGRIAENGGDGDGGVGNQRRHTLGNEHLCDDLQRGCAHALRHFDGVGADLAQAALGQTRHERKRCNDERHDGGGCADDGTDQPARQREDENH